MSAKKIEIKFMLSEFSIGFFECENFSLSWLNRFFVCLRRQKVGQGQEFYDF